MAVLLLAYFLIITLTMAISLAETHWLYGDEINS